MLEKREDYEKILREIKENEIKWEKKKDKINICFNAVIIKTIEIITILSIVTCILYSTMITVS